jgi:hypothetical protein
MAGDGGDSVDGVGLWIVEVKVLDVFVCRWTLEKDRFVRSSTKTRIGLTVVN